MTFGDGKTILHPVKNPLLGRVYPCFGMQNVISQ
jgi:hypothetical protein